MMVRTQTSLTSELLAQVRGRASECGVSLAEGIRRLVPRDIVDPPRSADRSQVFDLGSSRGNNIGLQKDRMIADAISAGKRGQSNET